MPPTRTQRDTHLIQVRSKVGPLLACVGQHTLVGKHVYVANQNDSQA